MFRARRGLRGVLFCTSLLFTWAILEFAVFPRCLPLVPLRHHVSIPWQIRPLAHSSKAATIPRSYIALAGDSYAAGMGDWLLRVGAKGNDGFHTAHLLHKALNRDVISLGSSGASSIRGFVELPLIHFDFFSRTWLFELEAPDLFLLMFYEGNDVQDNLREIAMRKDRGMQQHRLHDFAYFESEVMQDFVRERGWRNGPSKMGLIDNLFLLELVSNLLKFSTGSSDGNTNHFAFPGMEPSLVPSQNRAIVGGRVITLPACLQGPALECSTHDLTLATMVFAHSLRLLKESFPSTKVGVAYIPSVLACYELQSDEISIEAEPGRPNRYPSLSVTVRSELIAQEIRQACMNLGVPFLDARLHLRDAARTQTIHGPRDWRHLNEFGYRALAKAATAFVGEIGG